MLLTSLIGGIFSVGLKAAAVAATATAATAAAAVITAPLLKFIAPVFGPFVALAGAAVMGKKGK